MTTAARDTTLDVTRAVAIFGVVLMNFHTYLNKSEATNPSRPTWLTDLLDPVTGILTTRFAATFVLVAGIGASLFVRGALETGDRAAMTARRVVLVRRGLLLYGAGAILEWVWPGTILFYYGAFFVLAAVVCTWSDRWLVTLATSLIVVAAALSSWKLERILDGQSVAWLSPEPDGVRELAIRTFISHTHPVVPWFAFFLVGMLIGRRLDLFRRTRAMILVVALAVLAGVHLLRALVTPPLRVTAGEFRVALLVSTDPFDRSVSYSLSAIATAVAALVAVSYLAGSAGSSRIILALARSGRASLSLYLGHVAYFVVVVRWLGLIQGGGPTASILLTVSYIAPAVVLASWWVRVFGLGPAERAYRAIGG